MKKAKFEVLSKRMRVRLDAVPNFSPAPTTKEWERAGEREILFGKTEIGAGRERLLSPALSSIPWRRGSPLTPGPSTVSRYAQHAGLIFAAMFAPFWLAGCANLHGGANTPRLTATVQDY